MNNWEEKEDKLASEILSIEWEEKEDKLGALVIEIVNENKRLIREADGKDITQKIMVYNMARYFKQRIGESLDKARKEFDWILD